SRTPPTPPSLPYTTLFRSKPLTPPVLHNFPAYSRSEERCLPPAGRLGEADSLQKQRGRVADGQKRGPDFAGFDRLAVRTGRVGRSEEHTSELQSRENLVCR